jgi:hypothetical protein
MVKNLAFAAAAIFAASLLVGVPTANASPFLCTQKLNDDYVKCEGNSQCEIAAEANFVRCLEQDAATIS